MSLTITFGDVQKECVESTQDFVLPQNIIKNYGHLNLPYECEYKNRIPNPKRCAVLSIDFENRKLDVSNGMYRFYPSFDEVNIFKFVTRHKGKAYYEEVIF